MEFTKRTKLLNGSSETVVVYALSGKLLGGPSLDDFREDVIGEVLAGHERILFDLADINYVDSSGVGTLIGAYTDVSRRGGKIAAANLGEAVSNVFSGMKIFRLIRCFQSSDIALSDTNWEATAQA